MSGVRKRRQLCCLQWKYVYEWWWVSGCGQWKSDQIVFGLRHGQRQPNMCQLHGGVFQLVGRVHIRLQHFMPILLRPSLRPLPLLHPLGLAVQLAVHSDLQPKRRVCLPTVLLALQHPRLFLLWQFEELGRVHIRGQLRRYQN